MRSLVLVVALFFFQAPQPPPASIEGMVVRLGTSTPVVRARVSLGGAQTLTDESGRFVFPNLQPGRYTILAAHNAYVTGQYGEPSRGGPVTEITVGAGQVVKDIVLALIPKGAISGRVYDRFGDPVTNGNVQALKFAYQDGRRILIQVENARTNDLGEYRLFWLAPSPYVISAVPQESPAPDAEIHLPVYYPGTTDAATASPIELPAGINFTGVDLMITETRAVRVLGSVVNGLTGQLAPGAAVTLVPRRGTVATGSLQRIPQSVRGSFEFRHMAPGSYDLVASAPSGNTRLAASASIEVGSRDIENVALVLQPQISINGKVSIENAQLDPANLNPKNIRVELRRDPFIPELLILLPMVAADGTFTLSGVTPGEYRLKVSVSGLKGYVKSAHFGALDALNPPFRLDAPGQLDVVISLNAGSVDAIVSNNAQKPYAGATVVLVPDPPRRERFDLYHAAGSDASGAVHFDGVAPGDYKLFAWDEVPADSWQDQDFVRAYEDRGRPVRVLEGSKENVELRLILHN